VKNKGREAAAQEKNELVTCQPNVHGDTNDWFTAVRAADIAALRRLAAASGAVDVNSADEVRNNNKE